MPIDTFLIPAMSTLDMLRLQPTKIADGQGWVHFKTDDGTIISCRLFDDSFPDTASMLRVKGTKIILPKNINNVLDRAGVFAKRDHALDESISITIEEDKFIVHADADSGWFEESLPIKYTGPSLTICVTPYTLKSILNETQACEVSDRKLKFAGEGWVYIALLRHK
jgi:DNA polymerase III sliding clamp (beta) subunit (PCNA family)